MFDSVSAQHLLYINYAIGSLILLAGVVDDLRSQKVHNWLVILCAIVALVTSLATGGAAYMRDGVLAALAVFAAALPLVIARIVGAGDLKILMAFALLSSWQTVLFVLIVSLIWGAVLGVVRTAAAGELKVLAHNLLSVILAKNKLEPAKLHHIPYTVALFFAWGTWLATQISVGGAS